jgi:hypothetical protein
MAAVVTFLPFFNVSASGRIGKGLVLRRSPIHGLRQRVLVGVRLLSKQPGSGPAR